MAFIALAVGAAVGLVWLEGYVREDLGYAENVGQVEFVGDEPPWLTEELKNRIYAAATAEGEDLRLDDDVAASVQRNIEQRLPWLRDVRAEVSGEKILVSGQWRMPIARIRWGDTRYYVDEQLVVLDHVDLPRLAIVTITGLTVGPNPPAPGDVWDGDDLKAALEVLIKIARMDAAKNLDRPVLAEIESVDVSNFEGRKRRSAAHIVLYTHDKTQIIYGAEPGAWQRHLEATDEEKMAKLYTYFEMQGTLSGVKYIDLRNPQENINLPVDRYE
jgi:hypothetical protein